MDKRLIYFNEKAHSYTDDLGNKYTSTTTVIGNYEQKFKTIEMAKACARKGTGVYKGKTYKQIIKMWEKTKTDACIKGNAEHKYLEFNIKEATNYKRLEGNYINDRIYTIDEVIKDTRIGEIDEDTLIKLGLDKKRPKVFKFITTMAKSGYKVYAEVGVYSYEHLISGLVDCPLINFNTGKFIIVDWKTNKHDLIPNGIDALKYKSGYFKKDEYGCSTNKYIETSEYFSYPLDALQQSNYNKYSLQLSAYAYQMEMRGLIYEGAVLFHFRDEVYMLGNDEVTRTPELHGTKRTDVHLMPYYREECRAMFEHHKSGLIRNIQLELL